MSNLPLYDVAEIVDKHKNGMTPAKIAAELGTTARTVQRYLARAGRGCRPGRGPLTEQEVTRVNTLLDDGCSYWEVSRTLGRDVGTIRRYFPGRGWDRRQSGHLRGWYRSMIKRHGEPFEALIRDIGGF